MYKIGSVCSTWFPLHFCREGGFLSNNHVLGIIFEIRYQIRNETVCNSGLVHSDIKAILASSQLSYNPASNEWR
jgi:hypothetical protein